MMDQEISARFFWEKYFFAVRWLRRKKSTKFRSVGCEGPKITYIYIYIYIETLKLVGMPDALGEKALLTKDQKSLTTVNVATPKR